jgi:hypothetical protein
MITVQIKGATQLSSKLKKIQDKLDKLPQEAYKEFVQLTPVGDPNRWKTKYKPKNYTPGNARRKTKLKGDTIEANYPYAKRLNEGWSSQAPKGMVEPLMKFLRKRVKDIFAGK